MPAAFIEVHQAALWREGFREVCAEIKAWVGDLFDEDVVIRVSRLDVCCDMQGWEASGVPNTHYVTRADTIKREDETASGDLRQLSAGRSNHIRVSLYNKSKDVASKGKDWQIALWRRSGGYDATQKVYRLEYQMGSEFLRERAVDTLDDCIKKLPALWAYALGWFSLRVPSADDTNRSRWMESPVWLGLRLFLTGGEGPVAPRVTQQEQVVMRVKRSEDAAIGHLTSLMWLHGDKDLERAFDRMRRNWGKRREPFGDSIAARIEKKSLTMIGLGGAALS